MVNAVKEPEDDKDEYYAIYNIFQRFLQEYGNEKDKDLLIEAMMGLRAEFAIEHAIKGFGMDMETALALLSDHNDDLTALEKDQRDILIAAIDNLVDFAVAEEFQMVDHLPDIIDLEDNDSVEEAEDIFFRYNSLYSSIENQDIEYAMLVAATWVHYNENTVLTYMTQGDERVRPWHMALEGTSYPKYRFPAWLIPPIEHGCRCFLVEESMGSVADKMVTDVQASVLEMPDFINPVFRESVAKGGRIFSDAHSYFTIPKAKKKQLKGIAQKIKSKWLSQ